MGDFGSPRFNWTNNVQYNAMYRLNDQDSNLLFNGENNKSANIDDGNANFDKGIVSNRVELLSELDVVYENGWGGRISGIAWYDEIYNQSNDNSGFPPGGSAIPNHVSSGYDAAEFTDDTEEILGRDIELRDAFVFGRTNIGNSVLRFRAGQFASVWGESLFFADNGIAGAQNAFDIDRLMRDPTAEAKEFVLPVPQIGVDFQLNPDITLGAYYQFGFEPNRLPAVGSYMSTQDTGVTGAENMWVGPFTSIPLTREEEADDGGQFGLQLRWRLGYTDLGFYVVRFHDKNYQQVVNIGPSGPESYYLTYHEDTTAYGVSVSRSFGSVNLAAEASLRKDQALVSSGAHDFSALGLPATDNKDNPGYAVGDTAHINLSAIWLLDPGPLWQEATFVGEVAWNRVLDCDENCAAMDPNASRDAVAMRFVFEPVYRQVVSGLDLGVPIGVGYSPKGSRSGFSLAYPPEGGGDFTLGLNGTYLNTWQINLAYTNFFGASDGHLVERADDPFGDPAFSYKQARKDRDFLSFTISRRF
nr:DUF1302 family protein [Marinobacterium mangrovicola]